MHRDNFDIDKASAEEIIDKFNLEYYDKKIEDIENRIFNITAGKPEHFHKGDVFRNGNVLTGKEAEKRIRELRREKERCREDKKKYAAILSTVNSAKYRLEGLAQRDALLVSFNDAIRTIERHYDQEEKEHHRVPEFGEKLEKIILKARKNDRKELNTKKRKISGDVCKELKKHSKNIIIQIRDNFSLSIESLMRQSRFFAKSTLSGKNDFSYLFNRFFQDKSMDYRKDGRSIGIDVSSLERMEKILKEKDYDYGVSISVGDSRYKYRDLKNITERISFGKINTIARDLKNKYEEILEAGRQLEAYNCIITAFQNTEIKNSDSYINLVEMCRKEETKLSQRVEEVNKEFEKNNLTELIINHKKLEELYRKYIIATNNHYNSNEAQFSYSEHLKEAEEYRREMFVILSQYPDLNCIEYRIHIERKFGKVELRDLNREYGKTVVPQQPQVIQEQPVPATEVVRGPEERVTTFIPEREEVIRVEPYPTVRGPEERVTDVGSGTTDGAIQGKNEDELLKQDIEMPDYLTGFNVQYYQEYMIKKRTDPKFADLKYSEFLEMVRPDLVELIEIERKKEQRVENVYKKYIKYRASFQNKQNAMSFREFAKFHYNVESYDISSEYEERARSL